MKTANIIKHLSNQDNMIVKQQISMILDMFDNDITKKSIFTYVAMSG